MKLISIKLHSILDYIFGIFLILSPWIFMFNKDVFDAGSPIIIGVFVILYSFFTRYNYSLFKVIPIRVNLLLDVTCGVALAISPWLLNFSDIVYVPHLFLGVVMILLALNTNLNPKFSKAQMPG